MRAFQDIGRADLVLGISTSHAIIPISMGFPERGLVPFPFKEAEYLQLRCFSDEHYFEFLLIHDYLRLVVRGIEAGKMGKPLADLLPDDLALLFALQLVLLE